ncbi:MAG TPA: S8 family peptidase [Candidatus Kapabacteria bacterium]|nr:S8 family peptidase [Candidatus Kapabacteria bacterium]
MRRHPFRITAYSIALIVQISAISVFAQNAISKKYWIEFADKQIAASDFHPGNPIYDQTIARFSKKSLLRRAEAVRSAGLSATVTLEDAPICNSYIDSLNSISISVLSKSRWTNSVSALLSVSQIKQLQRYSFVKSIHPVLVSEPASAQGRTPRALPVPQTPTDQYCGYDSIIYHYGYSQEVLKDINVVPLHMMGFDGSGVMLGMCDVGFRWQAMIDIRKDRVLGTYDFVNKDSNVAVEGNDPPGSDGHGSNAMSAAAGYYLDSMIGPGYNTSLLLAKTENTVSESPAEEDNYAAALEWMEAKGVDIASSSLGYRKFDSAFTSYEYKDMDGKTAISTRAAARAAKLGVLICTAMGNYGQQDPPTLIAPSDADSILACGAIDISTNAIINFSSNGPTFDGRIKPDICAPGLNVPVLTADNIIVGFSGTSAATPLVAGACALIMQAHPEASAQQVRTAVLQSGKLFSDTLANNTYGYGKIDAYNAALKLGTIIGEVTLSKTDTIYSVCVPIAANNGVKDPEIVYAIADGAYSNTIPLSLVTDSLIYSATFPSLTKGTHIKYYIQTSDGADTATISPRRATDSVYSFYIGDTIITPLGLVHSSVVGDSIKIYPNPAGLVFYILMPQKAKAIVYDNLGKALIEYTQLNAYDNRLDISLLPNGAYRVVVQLADGNTKEYPLVIVH